MENGEGKVRNQSFQQKFEKSSVLMTEEIVMASFG